MLDMMHPVFRGIHMAVIVVSLTIVSIKPVPTAHPNGSAHASRGTASTVQSTRHIVASTATTSTRLRPKLTATPAEGISSVIARHLGFHESEWPLFWIAFWPAIITGIVAGLLVGVILSRFERRQEQRERRWQHEREVRTLKYSLRLCGAQPDWQVPRARLIDTMPAAAATMHSLLAPADVEGWQKSVVTEGALIQALGTFQSAYIAFCTTAQTLDAILDQAIASYIGGQRLVGTSHAIIAEFERGDGLKVYVATRVLGMDGSLALTRLGLTVSSLQVFNAAYTMITSPRDVEQRINEHLTVRDQLKDAIHAIRHSLGLGT